MKTSFGRKIEEILFQKVLYIFVLGSFECLEKTKGKIILLCEMVLTNMFLKNSEKNMFLKKK
jgi:hypothetical protein